MYESPVMYYAQRNSIPYETFVIAPIPDQEYTGKAITPALDVKQAGKTMTLDKDYSASYSNNINVGTANVTVVGLGDYRIFATTANFKIVKTNVEETTTKPTTTKPTTTKPTTMNPTTTKPTTANPTTTKKVTTTAKQTTTKKVTTTVPTTIAPTKQTTAKVQQEATTAKPVKVTTTKPASLKVSGNVYKLDKNGDYVSTKVKKPSI
ncbi:MAG: hypothetical protein ACI4V4_02260, partial [Eubacterium sp.]